MDKIASTPLGANGTADGSALSHYQRGREYLEALAEAAASILDGDASATVSAHQNSADSLLWSLDVADADQLRDFIAGLNRQAETRLEGLKSAQPVTVDAGHAALLMHNSLTLIMGRRGLGKHVHELLEWLRDAANMIDAPEEQLLAFYYVGSYTFTIDQVRGALCDDGESSRADYQALTEAVDKVDAFMALRHSESGTHYQAFIAGYRYAHSLCMS